jgi:hypothetical protein
MASLAEVVSASRMVSRDYRSLSDAGLMAHQTITASFQRVWYGRRC